jgi:hypothetical protein
MCSLRPKIAGQVHDAEKRITKLRAALANPDAAIAIRTPEHPDYVAPRTMTVGATSSGASQPALSGKPCGTSASPSPLARSRLESSAAKPFPDAAHAAITKTIVGRLNVLAKRGAITRTGKTPDALGPPNSN